METRQTVINKVTDYVKRLYGDGTEASFQKMFNAIDIDKDGKCSLDEVCTLLGYAGVGYLISRPAIAKEIIDLLDKDGDGKVSWSEFHSTFTSN